MAKIERFVRASSKYLSLSSLGLIAVFASGDSSCSGGSGGPGNTLAGTIITCACHCLPCLAHSSAFTTACTSFDTFSDPNAFNDLKAVSLCAAAGTVTASNVDPACAVICVQESYGNDINTRGGCRQLPEDVGTNSFQVNACDRNDSQWDPAKHFLSLRSSGGTVVSSQSSLTFSGETGPLNGSGSISFAVGQFPNTFAMDAVELDSPSTSLGGATVTSVRVVSSAPAIGLLSGTHFVIPKANIGGDLTAILDGAPQSLALAADGDLTGTYDPLAKTWSINVSMSGAGGSVQLSLQGTLVEIAPINNPGPPQTVECDLVTGLGPATLDGSGTSNPAGGALTISWFNTSTTPGALLGVGPVVNVLLPLGVTSITERSVNSSHDESVSQTSVTVVHRLPPILSVPTAVQTLTACAPDAPVKLSVPTAVDKCSPNVSVTGAVTVVNGAPANVPVGVDGSVTVAPGTFVVTWTAVDASGFTSSAQQTFNLVTNPTLYAMGQLQIGDGAHIVAGNVFGTINNSGPGMTEIDPHAQTGSIASIPSVTVGDGAQVAGSIISADQIIVAPGATVNGPIEPHTLPMLTLFPTVPTTLPPTTGSVHVKPGQFLALPPGSYGKIAIQPHATLSLTTGTYFASQLEMLPHSTVSLETAAGPVTLVIEGSWKNDGQFVDALHPVANILIDFLAPSPLLLDSSFGGTIVAPNATLVLGGMGHGSTEGFVGQFFAKSIEVAPNVTVTHAPLACP
jgi:hypothetical protein